MGLFTDILKGLPENAVLRDKVTDAEKRYAALETENAILKDDLRDAKAEIKELKNQIEKLTHKVDLDNIEVEILKAISAHESLEVEEIASLLKLPLQRVKFHLHKLVELRYISAPFSPFGGPSAYHLEYNGREYLVQNNLL
jgi:predicted nuclease with TOPRIM domain